MRIFTLLAMAVAVAGCGATSSPPPLDPTEGAVATDQTPAAPLTLFEIYESECDRWPADARNIFFQIFAGNAANGWSREDNVFLAVSSCTDPSNTWEGCLSCYMAIIDVVYDD